MIGPATSSWAEGEVRSIVDPVRRQVDASPDTPAVEGPDRTLSYADLWGASGAVAHLLREAKVVPGSRVGLVGDRSLEATAAVLGILRAGAACLPLDPTYPADRTRFMLEDAGAPVVLTGRRGDLPLDDGICEIDLPPVAELLGRGSTGAADGIALDDPAFVLYTSGSTGRPKGILMPHRPLVRLLDWQTTASSGGRDARTLHFTSLCFDPSFLELFSTWAAGGTVVLVDEATRSDPFALLRYLGTREVTRLFMPPLAVRQLAEAWTTAGGLPSSLRQVNAAGEQLRITDEMRRFFGALPHCVLVNQYGPAEAQVVTAHRLDGDPDGWPVLPPIGSPIPSADIHLLDAHGSPVDAGELGEIHIGGECLALGYVNRPEETAKRFVDDHLGGDVDARLYRTGDLGRMGPDGAIEFVGRADGQVKIRGHRVEPGEVEARLEGLPGVSAAAVVPRKDSSGALTLVAFVVPEAEGFRDPEAREHLAATLPAYMVPSRFERLDRLPLTPTGKVDRGALPRVGTSRPDLDGEYAAPRHRLERTVAEIWAQVLGLDRVGIRDNFFDLGGTSALALPVARQLSEASGRTVPVLALFENPTVAALAEHLERAAVEGAPAKPGSAPSPAASSRDTPSGAGPRGVGDDAVAIVGMDCRLPGADSVEEFWENLLQGVESITRFSPAELVEAGEDPALVDRDDFVGARGMIRDPSVFDAAFFGFSPREARLTDPQHRLFLESCWKALESAGYAPDRTGCRVGVWGGVSTGMEYSTYLLSNLHAGGALGPDEALPVMLGNANDYVTSRVSYKLDLTGPSVNVQTACSTSLVAVCQAVESLRRGECDMALAGGASVAYPRVSGHLYQEGGIESPDGHCRPFDADAAGTVFSDGVAVVALKRLKDAVRDGDTVHGIIRGVATNNDGASKVSFSAPSVDGQAQVIRRALADADVEPSSIGYVEAHGTATRLGDPLEVRGLGLAFGEEGGGTRSCALGSVKSNVGHTVAAAGVAGLIKAVLSLRQGTIPPSLHYRRPNPEIDFGSGPFFVADRALPWPGGHPRRAGVSSFGLGGTNAHVVVEEPPTPPPSGPGREVQLLVVSGRTPEARSTGSARLAAALRARPELDLADVGHTTRVGRSPLEYRRAIVASDRDEAIRALEEGTGDAVVNGRAAREAAGAIFLFPGGGAQYPGMARGLYESEPVFRRWLDRAATYLGDETPVLRALYSRDEDPLDLERPAVALPCLFSVEYALARLWMSWGVQPAVLVGHSMGEYTAACLAGVMALEDALELVRARARLFETLPSGSMTAVPLPESEVRSALEEGLSVAAANGPASCVVSGPTRAVEAFEAALLEEGAECRRVHISVAAHSEMVEPILDEFHSVVDGMELREPRIPVVSNVTGTWLSGEEARTAEYWVKHLRQTVRFADGLRTALADHGGALVEVGPGRTLASLARLHPDTDRTRAIVQSLRHVREEIPDTAFLLRSLGTLWAHGTEVDWTRFVDGEIRRRVPLPTYPFEGERYEVAPTPREAPVSRHPTPASRHPTQPALDPPVSAAPGPPTAAPRSGGSISGSPQPRGSTMTRRDRILWKLKDVVYDLSGIPEEEQDPDVSFLEMGFDSLFLTQASLGFQRAFDVRITFRQLFDEAPNLGALASYIDGELDDDAAVEGPPSATPAVSEPTVPASPRAQPGPGSPAALPDGTDTSELLRQVLQVQIQTNSALLAALGGQAAAPPAPTTQAPSPPAAADRAPTSPSHPQTAAPAAETEDVADAREADEKKPPPSHGPFRQVETTRMSGFDERQARFLDDFVERYIARTRGSKELTQAHRDTFADPRAVAGFRQDWKEIVYPLAVDRSKGSRFIDVDGNEYVDAVSGFGAIFFGHAPDFVVEAVDRQLHHSLDYGPLSTIAGDVAEMVCEATGMDRASFCNTGSEAVLAAMRTARTATGRDTIVTFQGDYHGIFDEVLVRRQDFGDRSRNVPVAPGIPRDASRHMVVLDYGSEASLDRIRELGREVAGILVEPVQSRNPALQPREFLHRLRDLCTELDIPLIFDEIITGFRAHPQGAQGWFGVEADIASYGKVVGGGMPIGIVAGKKRFMDALDGGSWQYGDDSFPEAGVTYFAGTFIRHPLSLSAVHAVLKHLKKNGSELQDRTNARTVRLTSELNEHFERERIPIQLEHFSSVFLPRFGGRPEFDTIFHRLLHYHGLHLWEGRPGFLTTAHTEEDVDRMIHAFKRAAEEMLEGGLLERTGDPGDAEPERVPFTSPQEELWVATRLNPGASQAYNEPVRLAMEGPLHMPALRRAAAQVVRRHDALRATVSDDDECFVVHPSMEVEVPLMDLTEMESVERERVRSERLEEMSRASFDLTEGPLVRLEVLKLSADRWELLMTVHHLVCDGWSISIALRDLSRFYTAAVTGRAMEMEPAMGLDDYRTWYEDESASVAAQDSEAYWLERLEDAPPPAELPVDHARPAERSYRGARQALRVEPGIGRRLKELGGRHRCTLFTSVFASFNVLLHKLTGRRDFVIGVPSAGQALLGENSLVAHCVHYLPIRTTLEPDRSFSRYLDTLRGEVLDANSHSLATFGSLIKKLPLPRDPGRAPLLTAGFNLDPAMTDLHFHGLTWTYDPMPRHHSKLDFAVNVVEEDGELLLEIDHNTDLIEPTTALRWAREWVALMEMLLEHPDRPLAQISLPERDRGAVPDPERLRVEAPRATVHELVEAWAEEAPEQPAVRDETGACLTYRALDERANRLAHHLLDLGVAPGAVIAVDLPRGVDLVVALVAVHKSGAAYLPLDESLPDDRVAFMLADSDAAALVTVKERARPPADFEGSLVLLDRDAARVESRPVERPEVPRDPQGLAHLIYTSGSTGAPKGVQTTHANVVNLLRGFDADIDIGPQDLMLAITTVAFDLSVIQVFGPLAHGATVFMADSETSRDPRRLAGLLEESGATLMKATPATWRALFESGWEGSPRLRAFSGGEALPPELARSLASRCAEAWNHYGPTETTGHTTSWRIPESVGESEVRIGRPLPNTYVRVLDGNLQSMPPGVAGELYVGGAGVARGYLNRPELTAERFIADPFADEDGPRLYRTGDIVRLHDDGTLEYVGRTDHQVKVRGFRMELGEVEARLRTHPHVADAVVRLWNAGTLDARLAAYVVLARTPPAGAGPVPTGSELRAYLRDRLPDYMVPGLVVELDDLPLSSRGKVDRSALPDPFGTNPVAGADAEPVGELESLIAEVWREILDVPTVGRGDNFFELGGHSLLAIRAAARIEDRTGVPVDPRSLFFQTVEHLARSMEETPRATRELVPSPD